MATGVYREGRYPPVPGPSSDDDDEEEIGDEGADGSDSKPAAVKAAASEGDDTGGGEGGPPSFFARLEAFFYAEKLPDYLVYADGAVEALGAMVSAVPVGMHVSPPPQLLLGAPLALWLRVAPVPTSSLCVPLERLTGRRCRAVCAQVYVVAPAEQVAPGGAVLAAVQQAGQEVRARRALAPSSMHPSAAPRKLGTAVCILITSSRAGFNAPSSPPLSSP